MARLARNQHGLANSLLIALILMIVLFITAASFAAWAFSSRQDYKNHSDQKVAVAVASEKTVVQATDAAQYAEAAKQPLKPYNGPSAYGAILIKYPKTWSAYVSESDGGGTPIDGYFQPDFVPSTTDPNQTFALRLQVVQESYDQVLAQYTSLAKQGTVTVTPYKAANVPSAIGVRVDGQIIPQKKGSMIVLPLRDKTFKLWTEADTYEADFNNNILPNYSFSP
jgi:hypothetical protein